MKNKIIHPRLAAGVFVIGYLLFFSILEVITKFPFISEYIFITGILCFPIMLFIYSKFDSTYDYEINDDRLFTIIGVIELCLLVILIIFLSKR